MALSPAGIGVKVSGRSAWLDEPAAMAYKRMLAAGCPGGGITDAGRTKAEQKALYDAYLRGELTATAAYPGTSKHETGRALDLAEPARSWVRAHGAAYGWHKDRVRNEPWHMEYEAASDKHSTTTPTPEPRRRDVLIIKDAHGDAHYEATDLAVRHIGDPGRLGSLVLAYGPVVELDAADITRLQWQADDRRNALVAQIAKALPAREGSDPKAVADEIARRLTA